MYRMVYRRVLCNYRMDGRDCISVCQSFSFGNSPISLSDHNGNYSYFLCLHGPQESGTLLRLRTTRYWPSGDAPLEEVVDGGVGGMVS